MFDVDCKDVPWRSGTGDSAKNMAIVQLPMGPIKYQKRYKISKLGHVLSAQSAAAVVGSRLLKRQSPVASISDAAGSTTFHTRCVYLPILSRNMWNKEKSAAVRKPRIQP